MFRMARPPLLLSISNLFATSFFLWVNKAGCEVYTSLQWSPDNPIFKTNAMRCVDGEPPHMSVLPSSKIYVICPTPVTVLETVQSTRKKQNLYENLWIIDDKESFETCNMSTSYAEELKKKNRQMKCNEPLGLKYFTVVFRGYSAEVGGLEFIPGNAYYFLATSDGTVGSLNDSSGGHCNDTKNGVSMKFKVYVCKDENDAKCADETAETFGKLKCNSRPTTKTPTTKPLTVTESDVKSSPIIVDPTTNRNTNPPKKAPQTGCDRKEDTFMILFIITLLLFVFFLMAVIYHCHRHTCPKLGTQDSEQGQLTPKVNDGYRYSMDLPDGKGLEDASNATNQESQIKNKNDTKPLNNSVKQELPDGKLPSRVSSRRAELHGKGPNNNITNEWSTSQML